jgi:phosphoserine phosphatase
LTHFVSLISDPNAPSVDQGLVDEARRLFQGAGEAVWLARSVAAEFAVEMAQGQARAAEADLRALAEGRAVDIAVLPAAHRRKKLLVADMDSTIIRQECIDELAELLGVRAQVARITERAMHGEIAFEPALRERVALLAGLSIDVVDDLLARRIEIMPGATTLVRTMRANGAHTALVSGGFTAFTGPVAELVGFDEQSANDLVIEDGRLAGRAVEPVRGREAKLETLLQLRERLGLSSEETMAVGDGANDLGMIEAAGLGVAYHAKPAVAAAADARIDHGDLTALLYLQGFTREAFVS